MLWLHRKAWVANVSILATYIHNPANKIGSPNKRDERQQIGSKGIAIVISFGRREIILEGNLKYQEWKKSNSNGKYLDKMESKYYKKYYNIGEVLNTYIILQKTTT